MSDTSDTEEDYGYCFEIDPDPVNGAKDRGVIEEEEIWPNGTELKIGFFNGSAEFQDTVRTHAVKWTEFANLTFTFVDSLDEETDIRIQFVEEGPSRSRIGKDALNAEQDIPTMSFNFTNLGPNMKRRHVLHEFGHAIGLHHEQLSPDAASIPWIKEAVYKDKGYSRDNTAEENRKIKSSVNHKYFNRLDPKEVKHTSFDNDSIMLYPIRKHWVSDVSFARGFNKDISAGDREVVAKYYPRE